MKEVYVVGFHAVEQALRRAPKKVLTLYVADEPRRCQVLKDLAKSANVPIESCSPRFLEQKAEHANHQGVGLKLKPTEPWSEGQLLDTLTKKTNPLVVLLDEVQDPHNVGAILRTAAAFDVDAIIAPSRNACGLTSAVRKTACGGDLIVPFVQVKNLVRCMRALQEMNLWLLGTALEPQAKPLNQHDLKGPLGIVLGAEGAGIRKNTREHCDFIATIPMTDAMASLNVSVATGICLYECYRQREVSL